MVFEFERSFRDLRLTDRLIMYCQLMKTFLLKYPKMNVYIREVFEILRDPSLNTNIREQIEIY